MTENAATKPNRSSRSSIRRATNADLDAIHTWLIEEDVQEVHGNFLCNWSLLERAHHDCELLVYVDGKTRLPVAFQLGRLIQPGILQVRYAYRGIGIGRKMVGRCIALAKKRDQCLLFIKCKPSTSIPFWEQMGFTLVENASGENCAYQVIEKSLQLPPQGVVAAVVISFFPEERKWELTTKPYSVCSPQAMLAADGGVYLAQRVQFHEEAFPNVRDVVVEIEVNGTCRFRDKAKYEEARRMGVTRCTNGYYIDVIQAL